MWCIDIYFNKIDGLFEKLDNVHASVKKKRLILVSQRETIMCSQKMKKKLLIVQMIQSGDIILNISQMVKPDNLKNAYDDVFAQLIYDVENYFRKQDISNFEAQAVYKATNALNVAIASSTYFDNKLSKFLPYDKKIKTRTLVSYPQKGYKLRILFLSLQRRLAKPCWFLYAHFLSFTMHTIMAC